MKNYYPYFQNRRLIHFFFFLTITASSLFAEVLIPADNPKINYYGRFDFGASSALRFNWSGTVIEANFPGPSIGFKLTDGNADYDVEIDGKLDTIIRTKSNVTQYTIATNLSEGSHTIRIIQRSENHWNAAVFEGFYLADGKALLSAAQKPSRKIEFIGDSYTVGYGNESINKSTNPDVSRDCSQNDQLRFYTNTNRSFPMLVAKAFHAQSMILGWSGAGMVRNYGAEGKRSADPYPIYYGKTLGDIEGNWNFSQWTPDLIVICLGTNDYSTPPHPDDTMFTNAYHAFIARVLGNYPNAQILCVGTGDTVNKYVKRVVSQETGALGHAKVYLDSFPTNLSMTGCDWHPSIGDDSLIAKVIVKNIMKNLNWDTSTQVSVEERRSFKKNEPSLIVRVTGNRATVIGSPKMSEGAFIRITDLKGRIAGGGRLDSRRTFFWDVSGAAGGVYFIGNEKIGWTTMVMK